MCFCFDGENAVAAFRPERCREHLPGARAEQPVHSQAEPSQFGTAGSFAPADAGPVRHIAVGVEEY